MIYDLTHELEVIKAFFARGIAWVASEAADESARLALLERSDEEIIEQVLTHPHGAEALEQIVFRSVINELNSLYEFTLHQVWIGLHGLNVPIISNKGKHVGDDIVFVSNRQQIEKNLNDMNLMGNAITSVEVWPRRREILEIKELAEGFKHRQRLQPFPEDCYSEKNKGRAARRVEPDNSADENPIASYRLTQIQVSIYLDAVTELLRWLAVKRYCV